MGLSNGVNFLLLLIFTIVTADSMDLIRGTNVSLVEGTHGDNGDVGVGERCDRDSDCVGYPDETWCKVGSCWCNDGYIIVGTEHLKCLQILNELGAPCEDKQQCTQGVPGQLSDCLESDNTESKVCTCIDEAVKGDSDMKCYPKATLIGDTCTQNSQCQANLGKQSECLENVCKCTIGDVAGFNGTKCLSIVNELGGECFVDEQCTWGVPGELSICSSGVCQCREDSVNPEGENQCFLKMDRLGEPCNMDGECVANFGHLSVCYEFQCGCKSGLGIVKPDLSKCLPVSEEISDSCEMSQQCTEGITGEMSECNAQGACACTEEAVNEEGEHVCRKKAMSVGDPCLRNAQCHANLGGLSECLLGETCVCIKDYGVPSMIGDRCLPVVNYIGGECKERQQCTTGIPGRYSDCVTSSLVPDMTVCNCTEGTETQPGQHECKKPVVLIGEVCEDDKQCVGEPGESSACDSHGICGCLGGFIPNTYKDNCFAIRNRIGDECEEATQCQKGIPGVLSDCVNRICNCTQFSVHQQGENFCHRRATLVGDSCQIHDQCEVNLGNYSQCLTGQCQCERGSDPSSDQSKCVSIVQ